MFNRSRGLMAWIALTFSFSIGAGDFSQNVIFEDNFDTVDDDNVVIPVRQTQIVLTDDIRSNLQFGAPIDVSGDRLAVGALGDDENGFSAGAVYLFERDASSQWSQETKILAEDGEMLDFFGVRLSLDGERLVSGAFGDSEHGFLSGSAYIFERGSGSTWRQIEQLFADEPEAEDFFGNAVSFDGNRVAVGADGDKNNSAKSGAVYIFERNSQGEWNKVARLIASDGEAGDRFGASASLDGNRIAIGADGDDDKGENSGAVYIFDRSSSGAWNETVKLTASDGAAEDFFGGVQLNGNRLILGVPLDDDLGTNSGSVFIFELEAGVWQETVKLTASDGKAEDHFGISFINNGDRLAIGANENNNQGAVYIFTKMGGSWREVTKLTASDGAVNDLFGSAAVFAGDQLIIGAHLNDSPMVDTGSVYIFSQ